METGRDAAVSSRQAMTQDVEETVNDLAFRAVDPVNVHVRDLNLDIDVSASGLSALTTAFGRKKGTQEAEVKAILKDVNANIPSGSLTAIIGSSGSGKTSVLNTLSNRIAIGRLRTTGDITYNGSAQLRSIRSAYVMQQDVLIPTLTVRETLHYAAELRLPPPTTAEDRKKIVEDVILELGLKECADTRIGNNVHKGCSGGEKRRTSLAVQMLSNPSVLFCDEVTTGLDAATAFQLVTTLKALAVKGRTIICSIHQPRSEIWQLFDHVLLLAKGSPLYSGRKTECLAYFEQLGHILPPFVNPAEFLIDLAAIDTRSPEAEASSATRVQGLIQAFQVSPENSGLQTVEAKSLIGPTESAEEKFSQHHATLSHQVRVLTGRTFKTTYRDPVSTYFGADSSRSVLEIGSRNVFQEQDDIQMSCDSACNVLEIMLTHKRLQMGIAGSMLEATSMAVITGWIFLQLDGSLSGIRSREGALYTAASLRKTFFQNSSSPAQDEFSNCGTWCRRESSCHPSHSLNTAYWPDLSADGNADSKPFQKAILFFYSNATV